MSSFLTLDHDLFDFAHSTSLPKALREWLRSQEDQGLTLLHGFKPAGGKLRMTHFCFSEVEHASMYVLALSDGENILSYVGYNIFPIRDKYIVMLEYICTEKKRAGQHLNRHLLSILIAWACKQKNMTGIIADSINEKSGRLLSRYFGFAKAHPEVFLDMEVSGVVPKKEAEVLRWAYCCRHRQAAPDWRTVWITHREVQVAWHDAMQMLPYFNTHIHLDAPGVRAWVLQLLKSPRTDAV